MKKKLLIFLVLAALVIAAVYILIPNRIKVDKRLTIEASKNALYRKLSNPDTWDEWWPGDGRAFDAPGTYILNGMAFKPGPAKVISLPISVATPTLTAFSELTLIPHQTDSTTLHLEALIPTSYNPLKRILAFFRSRKLENSFSTILQSINNRYSNIKNLYGYDIQKKLVVDSTLLFTFEEVKGFPGIDKIYALIDELKNHIKKGAARETSFPMLNIHTTDSITYLVKVAIPVDKKLSSSGNISYRWMLGGGNILITEVKGGQHEINKAYEQVLHYISDYQRIAPAIPFESLVTDRREEPDSNKWVTRIYYPVM